MAKINACLYNYFNGSVPSLKRSSSIEDLWDAVADAYNTDASVLLSKGTAHITFNINGKTYECIRPSSEIRIERDGSLKEERYDILLEDALMHIVSNKLIRKKRANARKTRK